MVEILSETPVIKSQRKLAVGWVVVLCVVFIILSSYFSIAVVTADLSGTGQWLRDFAKSPGAAACAALIAAIIAFYGISKQVRVSREALDHQQSAVRTSAWWEMFEWASNRGIPLKADDTPLPDSITVSTLQALSSEATETVQKVACGRVIDAITTRMESIEEKPAPRESNVLNYSVKSTEAVNALASYVSSNRGTPAASPAAEAMIYGYEVEEALSSTVDGELELRISPKIATSGPGTTFFTADATVESGDHRVIVEVKKFRRGSGDANDMSRIRNNALAWLKKIRSSGIVDPILLVTPHPAVLTPEQERQYQCIATQWRGAEDNGSLTVALQEVFRAFGGEHGAL